jgi:hypothetical protein
MNKRLQERIGIWIKRKRSRKSAARPTVVANSAKWSRLATEWTMSARLQLDCPVTVAAKPCAFAAAAQAGDRKDEVNKVLGGSSYIHEILSSRCPSGLQTCPERSVRNDIIV